VNDTATSIPTQSQLVLQEVQPALLGLMDGSVSTLAPIFATAGLTGRPLSAFFVGLAASLGAGLSMGLSEALSDDGTDRTGTAGAPRGRSPVSRPRSEACCTRFRSYFRISLSALKLAYIVVACELLAIAFIRYRFMGGALADTIVQVVIGGALVFAMGVCLAHIGAA